jgi:hypothetical protein
MIGLAVVAVFAAIVIYQRVLAYDHSAVRHLPPDTLEVARIDVERVLVYEPMRQHWVPLVDSLGLPLSAPSEPRLARLHRATRIELGLDLREIVFGRGARPGEWVLVLGGKFPKENVVAGIARVLDDEGPRWQVSPDGKVAVSQSNGLAIGQADDGAIVIAPTEDRVRSALEPSRTYEQLGVPLSSGAALAAKGEPLAERVTSVVRIAPQLATAGRVERVTGELSLGTPSRGRLVLRFAPGTDTVRAESQVRAALVELDRAVAGRRSLSPFATPLKTAQVSSTVAGIVEIAFDWPEGELDRGAQAVGVWARGKGR